MTDNVVPFPAKFGTVEDILAKLTKANAAGDVAQMICITLDQNARPMVYNTHATVMQAVFMSWFLEQYVLRICKETGLSA